MIIRSSDCKLQPELNIVYFSCIEWNSAWQRPQQLATRLSRLGRMLYINPLGTRSVQSKDITRLWDRLTFRFRSGQESSPQSQLTIHNPLLYIPFVGSDAVNQINGRVLSQRLRNWMTHFGVMDPILWIGVPSRAVLEAVKKIPSSMVVYDCIDNFAHFHNGDARIAGTEFQLASRAQFVFATAKELYDRMKKINPRTFFLPNAADFEHFCQAADKSLPAPPDIAGLPEPILGYYGELAQWFDFDLVERLARENSNWTVVLIGKIHGKAGQGLLRLPNVHFLGPKSYRELPAYLSRFDVCLLPFKVNTLTSSVNPVKLYEYLSAGKPVVSTPLKEVLTFGDVVQIAESNEFPKAIQSALDTQVDEGMIAKRQDFARRNTWERRIEDILEILETEVFRTS